MKNATQIITSLQNKPQFSKLNRFKCIDKIKSMFMPSFTKFVKFAYIRNDTLFFVLNHNAGKQEFDNNIQTIKSALNFYTPSECEKNSIKDIKAFVTHSPRIKQKQKKILYQSYKERATGDLKVKIDDKKLEKISQEIQNIIKKRKT
jgi:hypothetical protein